MKWTSSHIERSDMLPSRRQSWITRWFDKPDCIAMMLHRILCCHSLLSFLHLRNLNLEIYMLNLVKHLLQILLTPHLLNLYLIFSHQNLCQLLLSLYILNSRSLNLIRQWLNFFYSAQSINFPLQSEQFNPFRSFLQLSIITPMFLKIILKLGIVVLYNLQFLLYQHIHNIFKMTLNSFDQL